MRSLIYNIRLIGPDKHQRININIFLKKVNLKLFNIVDNDNSVGDPYMYSVISR